MPDRVEGRRRRAGLVAGRDEDRLLRARPPRGVRGGGRQEARSAPVHAAPLQARLGRLDGRPEAAPLRRPRRRLGRGEADHRRRLRGLAPDVDARRQEHRVLVRAERELGRRAQGRHLRRGGRRRRAEAADAERRGVPRTELLARREATRREVGSRRLRLPTPHPDRRDGRVGRELPRPDRLARPHLRPLPRDPRAHLGRRLDRLRDRGPRQHPRLPRLAGRRRAGAGRGRRHRPLGLRRRRRPRCAHRLDRAEPRRALRRRQAADGDRQGVRLRTRAERAGAVHGDLEGRLRGRGLDRPPRRLRGGQDATRRC